MAAVYDYPSGMDGQDVCLRGQCVKPRLTVAERGLQHLGGVCLSFARAWHGGTVSCHSHTQLSESPCSLGPCTVHCALKSVFSNISLGRADKTISVRPHVITAWLGACRNGYRNQICLYTVRIRCRY